MGARKGTYLDTRLPVAERAKAKGKEKAESS